MMPDLVYDFKDIASRMKGELKQEPKMKIMSIRPVSWWKNRSFCAPCNGSGVDPMNGGTCSHCLGSGVSP